MSRCSHLHEIERKVKGAAALLAPIVRDALELWNQAADDLHGHPQQKGTEATRSLVYSALADAPWRKQECKPPRQVAWLQKHLPGLCSAMQECAKKQLDMAEKRSSILRALLRCKDLPDDAAQLKAECDACILVKVQVWAWLLILRVKTLCAAMKTLQELIAAHDVGKHEELEASAGFIDMLYLTLQETLAVQLKVLEKSMEIHTHFWMMDARVDFGPPEPSEGMYDIHDALFRAELVWLQLVGQLLSHHLSAVHILYILDWSVLQTACPSGTSEHALVRFELSRLFAQPDVLLELCNSLSPSFVKDRLHEFEISAEQLQAAGLPAMQMQQVFQLIDDEDERRRKRLEAHRDEVSRHAGHDNQSGGSQVPSNNESSIGPTAAHSGTSGVLDEADGDIFDMYALLRMMYG